MSLRAVLLDAHGTLIHLTEPAGDVYARLAAVQGAEIPAWRFQDAFERVLERAPSMVFPSVGEAECARRERAWWWQRVRETLRAADSEVILPDFEAWFAALWTHFGRPEAWTCAPGAREALRGLAKAGLQTAVVSNFDHRLDAILAGLGLAEGLAAIVRPAHAGAAKPDRRMFEYALACLGVTADEALYVGDDPERDLSGARAAGLRAIDVTRLATLADLSRHLDPPCPPESESPE